MSIPNNLNLLKLGYAIHGRSAQNSPLKQSEVLFGIREYAESAMIEHHHVVAMRLIDRNGLVDASGRSGVLQIEHRLRWAEWVGIRPSTSADR
jgi:hypothetical protein